LERGETVERYGVKAIYRNPHTRRTVNKKELERMATIYPDVAKVFETKEIRASVQVKA